MTLRHSSLVVLLAMAGLTVEAASAQVPAPATPPPALALTGDAENGAQIFKKCAACHEIGPTAKNSVGPVLNGIVGRMAGTYPGYAYSDANKSSGIVWTEATLAAYLPAPKMFLPGTKMSFVGLMMPQDVADVIAYLKQYDAQGNKVAAK
jgi:cytochrome c